LYYRKDVIPLSDLDKCFQTPRLLVLTLLIIALLAGELGSIPFWAAPVPFPNGGFETFPGGGLNDWRWPDNDWVWDGSVAHNGAHSARVHRIFGGETASLRSAYISVQPSTVYTLTYWLRTQDATSCPSVNIYQYTSAGVQTGSILSAYANIGDGTNDWMLVTYRFQTMPDADTIQVRLFLWTDTTGTFWFDDFGLDQGAPVLYPFQTGFPVVASGWIFYSSPTVTDIDGDGDNELLVGSGNTVRGWDDTGVELPGFPLATGDKRINSQLALADLDRDGDLEIVAGTRAPLANVQGRVFVWHHTGALLSAWPQSVAWNTQYSNNDARVSSVALADIDRDNDLEILAGTTNNASGYPGSGIAVPNLYAWHADGSLVAGYWPTWHTTAGIYGAIAAGDLNGDGVADVIVGRDHHYLNVYTSDGSSLSGWPIQTFLDGNDGNYQTDMRVEYGFSAPIMADLDGDGTMECIVAGNVKGPGNQDVILNSGVLVLEPDSIRRPGWETAALGDGILAYEYLPRQAPAVADLDNDGQLEIIVATYDGWIRVYKADQAVLWAFDYTQGAVLFASEPVIGDINGDGALEIVFGTYVPMQTECDRDGPVGVWGLEADGTVMPGFPLPVSTPGVRAAPTLNDLDGDGDLEILVAAIAGQLFVWDTPTPYAPTRLPWPTGRHDLCRSATYVRLEPDFSPTRKFATPLVARQDERATFAIQVVSSVPITYAIRLTDTIPSGISYIPGTLTATLGVVTDTTGALQWSGVLSDTSKVDVTYDVVVTTAATRLISNTVVIDTASNGLLTRTGYIYANGFSTYLPLIVKSCCF
jgi:uncharacterized repeat protein (TIGR01451 family)